MCIGLFSETPEKFLFEKLRFKKLNFENFVTNDQY